MHTVAAPRSPPTDSPDSPSAAHRPKTFYVCACAHAHPTLEAVGWTALAQLSGGTTVLYVVLDLLVTVPTSVPSLVNFELFVTVCVPSPY